VLPTVVDPIVAIDVPLRKFGDAETDALVSGWGAPACEIIFAAGTTQVRMVMMTRPSSARPCLFGSD
jgi:hypothetical protein